MGFFDTRVSGVERIFHMITPVMARMMPAMGSRGIKGQRIINIRQAMPPIIMMKVPAKSRTNLDIKPIKRETNLSMNI